MRVIAALNIGALREFWDGLFGGFAPTGVSVLPMLVITYLEGF
jgi:hypothetical protein